jgi:hypothetical protein
MVFPTPVPLLVTAQILYAVATVSQGYSLTKVHATYHRPDVIADSMTIFRRIAGSFPP